MVTLVCENNLPYNEIKAIKELKDNPTMNIKKADYYSQRLYYSHYEQTR